MGFFCIKTHQLSTLFQENYMVSIKGDESVLEHSNMENALVNKQIKILLQRSNTVNRQ